MEKKKEERKKERKKNLSVRPLWLVEQWAKAQWTTRKLVRACPVFWTLLSSQCIRIPLLQAGRKFRPPHPGWRWWLWLQMTLLSLHCVQAYVNRRQWLKVRSYRRWWVIEVTQTHLIFSVEFYIVCVTKVHLMFIGPCVIVIVEEWKINLMSLAVLLHFLCAQYVSENNISIIRSLRLCCWITTSVVLFSVRCVCFSAQNEHHSNPAAPNLQHTTNWE